VQVSVQFLGSHLMPHGPLQALQWAGWPKVLASCHSCDSLLHWAMAWETISSDWQLEQTGVDRVARQLTICAGAGSGLELNGLRSKASRIFIFP
jgi:hypothetical protein